MFTGKLRILMNSLHMKPWNIYHSDDKYVLYSICFENSSLYYWENKVDLDSENEFEDDAVYRKIWMNCMACLYLH